MIFAIVIAFIFIVLLVQFVLVSTFIIGKNLFQNLFLLLSVVATLYLLPNTYGFLVSIFLFSIVNLINYCLKKIRKSFL